MSACACILLRSSCAGMAARPTPVASSARVSVSAGVNRPLSWPIVPAAHGRAVSVMLSPIRNLRGQAASARNPCLLPPGALCRAGGPARAFYAEKGRRPRGRHHRARRRRSAKRHRRRRQAAAQHAYVVCARRRGGVPCGASARSKKIIAAHAADKAASRAEQAAAAYTRNRHVMSCAALANRQGEQDSKSKSSVSQYDTSSRRRHHRDAWRDDNLFARIERCSTSPVFC